VEAGYPKKKALWGGGPVSGVKLKEGQSIWGLIETQDYYSKEICQHKPMKKALLGLIVAVMWLGGLRLSASGIVPGIGRTLGRREEIDSGFAEGQILNPTRCYRNPSLRGSW
jgi:hypothetical protein